MNRNRLLVIGTIALAIAGFASFGIYRVLRLSMSASQGSQVTVVAAASELSVGQRLEEKDIRLVKMPAKELPEGYFANVQDVIGRGVLQPMSRNELLLSSKVAGANSGSGLPSLIPEGMRAVSVKVNDVISVAGFVTPGTRVDVLLTGTPSAKNSNNEDVQTTTVLENVQVIAAGQQLQKKSDGSAENVPVITLLVNPDDAQKLTLASSEGKIQLSLRNPVDNEPKKPITVRNAALYGAPPVVTRVIRDGNRKIVVKVPAPQPVPYTVEMIRGEKRDIAKF